MLEYVKRTDYLQQLKEFKNTPSVVKVITGMRRCGKSTLLEQYIQELIESGINEKYIFHMNFESFTGQERISNDELKKTLKSLPNDKMVYVFLDEIQNIDRWEMIVAALQIEKNYDVYITGSNSNMLSTDLATHLSGRYIEIKMLPLSFKEYLELRPGDKEERFNQYLMFGGLPDTDPDKGERYCRGYLEGVFNTVLIKDILNRMRTDDIGKIKTIAKYLYSNVGNITNKSNIVKATGLNHYTVDRYIDGMESALLFYHTDKYDIVGKKILSTNGKYYASDTGMKNVALSGTGTPDIGRLIENVVYLELLRRGYTVKIGSYRDKEIDFTATKWENREYYQISVSLYDPNTKEREMRPLKSVKDNFSKTILTLDKIGLGTDEGIKTANVIDWLLN